MKNIFTVQLYYTSAIFGVKNYHFNQITVQYISNGSFAHKEFLVTTKKFLTEKYTLDSHYNLGCQYQISKNSGAPLTVLFFFFWQTGFFEIIILFCPVVTEKLNLLLHYYIIITSKTRKQSKFNIIS